MVSEIFLMKMGRFRELFLKYGIMNSDIRWRETDNAWPIE